MANIELLSEINRRYPEKNIPFLHKQNLDWEKRKPLQGVKILHNLMNTFETLLKLEPLLRAGADLTLTRLDVIQTPYQKEIDEILNQCGFRYIPDYKDLKGEFDIGMDCAARLLSIPQITIRRGTVEITQYGTVRYQKTATPYPVISVDDSYLKNLECMYGTGEAFIRAFQELTGEDLKDRPFLIFGYGKVGQGIVKYLSPFTRNILIVEKSLSALDRAARRGLSVIASHRVGEIKKAASEAFGIVTATGISHLLSTYLDPKDLTTAYLANMGADDEIGSLFDSYPGFSITGFRSTSG